MECKLVSMDNHIGVFDTDYDTGPVIDFFEDLVENGLIIPRNEKIGKHLKVKDTTVSLPMMINIRKDVQTKFLKDYGECTYAAFQEYVKTYPTLEEFKLQQLIINLQCTKPGEGYHLWHCENTGGSGSRVCATAMFLIDDFEGGETEFLHQSCRVKPKQGRIIVFPATYTHVHRGNPPLDGKKYILTSWLEQQ